MLQSTLGVVVKISRWERERDHFHSSMSSLQTETETETCLPWDLVVPHYHCETLFRTISQRLNIFLGLDCGLQTFDHGMNRRLQSRPFKLIAGFSILLTYIFLTPSTLITIRLIFSHRLSSLCASLVGLLVGTSHAICADWTSVGGLIRPGGKVEGDGRRSA